MRRTAAIRFFLVLAALAAPLVAAACLDDHAAEDCTLLLTCPLPDAGDGGDGDTDH